MTVRVGIVGLGKIGERHINALSTMENVEITGYCDSDELLYGQHSKVLKAPFFSDCDSLVTDGNNDAIDVCVPTYLHHEVILKALESNKHVFCEKPLTHDMEYAREIQKKAGEKQRIVMVGYLYRFHPAFELLHDILTKGVIGRPYYAIFRIGGRGGHRAWKHQKDKAGGAAYDMLTHMLALALYNFGEPAEVVPLFSDIILKEREIDGETVRVDAEDCILCRLRTTEGVQIILLADLITPSFMNTVEVHGDNGSFFGSIVSRYPTIVYCKEPRDIYALGDNVFNFAPVNLIEKELRYFIDCVTNSHRPMNSVAESIRVLEITEKLRGKA